MPQQMGDVLDVVVAVSVGVPVENDAGEEVAIVTVVDRAGRAMRFPIKSGDLAADAAAALLNVRGSLRRSAAEQRDYAERARAIKVAQLVEIALMAGTEAGDVSDAQVRGRLLAVLSSRRGKPCSASNDTWALVSERLREVSRTAGGEETRPTSVVASGSVTDVPSTVPVIVDGGSTGRRVIQ